MIRDATPADIPRLIELGQAMHAESRFASRPWSARKVCGLMDWLIIEDDGCLLVAEHDGVIVGGFLGVVQNDWCTEARIASDFALYVEPSRRGSLAGARLLKAYREWAQCRGAHDIEAGINTGVNLEASSRLYAALGFLPVGNLFAYQERK